MFDGVPIEQFHHFISTPTSRIPSNPSLIQTPPISTSTNLNFLSFDPLLFPPLPTPTHHQPLFHSHHLLRAPTRDQFNGTEPKVDQEIDQGIDINDSWTNDEVIQLLRIKSSSENWFRDFNWDHVSRKLGEMGYKRSAEKCKEKFEEETCRNFSSATTGYHHKNTTSRYLTSDQELDEHLYNTTHHHNMGIQSPENPIISHHEEQAQVHEKVGENQEAQRQKGHFESQVHEQGEGGERDDYKTQGQKGHFDTQVHEQGGGENHETQRQKGHFDNDSDEIIVQEPTQDTSAQEMAKSKKRKRKHHKFKMVKGLCVDLVKKMMTQQEEMHKKLLEDMASRDEEKIKREEAWRQEEMERIKREIHIREQEQEIVRDRQSTITEFINKITSFDQKIRLPSGMTIPQCEITEIPSSKTTTEDPNIENSMVVKDDIGKRWPRDEVLALINIRSNVNNGGISGSNDGGGGGSLWERISQGMLELGYKRSAKRCKEKWENINKYFRKTKDANKKRSLDSRTCPYYHQLSKLYNQEKQEPSSNSVGVPPSGEPENHPSKVMPEN